MSLVPPFFKNFGKSLCDLFKEQYDFVRAVKIKSTTSNGVVFESSVNGSNEGGVKATYKQADIGTLQAEVLTTGCAKYSLKNDKLHKGLTVKLSGDEKPSGKVEVDYSLEHTALSLTADVAAATCVDAAVVAGFDGASVGGHFKYDVVGHQPKDYNLGVEYSMPSSSSSPDLTFTARTCDSISKVCLGYFHRYSPSLQFGAQFSYGLKDGKNELTVGTSHVLDHSALIKAKINTNGTFAAAVEHKLAYPAAKVVLALQYDAKSIPRPQQFGVTLQLGDN